MPADLMLSSHPCKFTTTLRAKAYIITPTFSSLSVNLAHAVSYLGKDMDYRIPAALLVTSFSLIPVITVAQTSHSSSDSTQVQVWFSPGYGKGELSWNIADPSGSPDVLSQLDYTDLKLVTGELGAHLEYQQIPQARLILESSLLFGSIRQGDAQDRDWFGDGRSDLVSQSTAEINDDHIGRFSLAVGYQVPITSWLSLSPMMGYDYQEQKLNFINGVQVVSVPHEDFRPPEIGRAH